MQPSESERQQAESFKYKLESRMKKIATWKTTPEYKKYIEDYPKVRRFYMKKY